MEERRLCGGRPLLAVPFGHDRTHNSTHTCRIDTRHTEARHTSWAPYSHHRRLTVDLDAPVVDVNDSDGGTTNRRWSVRGPSIVVAVVVALALLAGSGIVGTAAAAEAPVCDTVTIEGSGTAADPHRVATLEQLQCIGEAPGTGTFGAYFELQKNIDAGETNTWNDGAGFDPIASSDQSFYARFDGNGFVISNLHIDRPDTESVGLFAYVLDYPIGNVSLESANITGGEETGGFVGTNGGTVSNVSVDGTVSGEDDTGGLVGANRGEVMNSSAVASVDGDDSTGGLVGYNFDTVRNSSAAGSVNGSEQVGGLVGRSRGDVYTSSATGDVEGSDRVGGLVGRLDGTVTESHASGDATGSDNYVGGLIGINNYGDVSESYATGSVTGETRLGGFVGRNLGEISDAFAAGAVDNGQDVFIGGFAGDNDDGTITDAYWDSDRGYFSAGVGNDVGGRGPGDVTDLFPTTDMQGSTYATELDDLFDSGSWTTVAGDYPDLVNNPRMLSTRHYDEPSDGEMDTILGDMETDGDGNLVVTSDKALQAINRDGTARSDDYRLGLDIDASGTDEWNSGTGFLPVGYSNNEFSGSFDGDGHVVSELTIDREGNDIGLFSTASEGSTIERVGVESVDITGNVRVGGLVGDNAGGTVRASHMTGTVTGDDTVGGLIGRSTDSGLVTESFSSGSVTGSGTEIGGLVGNNTVGSTVNESYATGAVTGGTAVGGLVGQNDATVTDGYATGLVSGTDTGGVIGTNDGGTVTAVYWDTETTGQSTSAGTAARYGLPTARMTGLNATIGLFELDFEHEWQPAITRDAYPVLASDSAFTGAAAAYDGLVVGDGSASTPFRVSTVYELQLISERLGEGDSFELANDINASRTAEWFDEGSGPQGFEPLGNDTLGFDGTFDGGEYAITNLTINRSGHDSIGLFGHLDTNGIVRSVTVDGLAVSGKHNVGGLVGTNDGEITGSSVAGRVNGSQRVGGLVGRNTDTVRESVAFAQVNGTTAEIGGAVGHNDGTVMKVAATGTVDGDGTVGGLVGRNLADGDVQQSYATGAVVNGTAVGGVVGSNEDGDVVNTYATGAVNGTTAGGLVGQNQGGVIRLSYAVGRVNATATDVGGLLGNNSADATLEDSYWDRGTTNQSDGVNGTAGTITDLVGFGSRSDTTATTDMQGASAVSEMNALDFTNAWAATDGYPVLAWAVDSVDLTLGTGSLTAGETTDATVGVGLVDSAKRTATATSDYSSNDTNVATIDNAVARGTGGGTALLSADVGGVVDSEPLSVTALPSTDDDSSGGGGGGGGGLRPTPRTTVTVDAPTEDAADNDGEGPDSAADNDADQPDTRISVADPEPGQTLVIEGRDAYITDGTPESGGGVTGDGADTGSDSGSAGADPAANGNVRSDRLSVAIDTDRDFELSITTYEPDFTRSSGRQRSQPSAGPLASGGALLGPVGAPRQRSAPDTVRTAAGSFAAETNTLSAGYVDIEHTLAAEEIAGATYEFSIRRAYLDELGVDAEGVTLYHRLDGEWVPRETAPTDTDGTYYRFAGTMPEFSVFALGTGAPPIGVSEASLSASTVETGDSATVSATVENRGRDAAEQTIELTIDGEVVGSESVSLAAGETTEIDFAYTPTAAGEYTLAVGGVDVGVLTVGEGGPPWVLAMLLLAVAAVIGVLWRRRDD